MLHNFFTLTVSYAAFTHSGKQYKHNQDAVLLGDVTLQKPRFWQDSIEICLPKHTESNFEKITPPLFIRLAIK